VRAVLDANVLISALIRPAGPPGRIVARFLEDHAYELVSSPAILEELRRSLRYPKVRRYLPASGEELDLWVDALRSVVLLVKGSISQRVVAADPADDVYLATAVDGLAEFVVTGGRHLLEVSRFQGIRIVTPREFLTILETL
jgi:putative PIN family toxin of toxin-antitoxin system